ncbi:MAG: (4Fe-4S)-binding protein [bacterium]
MPDHTEDDVHEYRTALITVEWRPHRCQHSGNCVRALPAVFEPARRPWIMPESDTADAVAAAVSRCPSGALQYVRHDSPSNPTHSDTA